MIEGRKQPKVPEKITRITDKAIACRKFFGAFLIDKKLIKEGTVFFNASNGKHIESVLLEDHGRLFHVKKWDEITIKLKAAAGQLISPTLRVSYPRVDEGEDVTFFFKNSIINKWAIKYKLIDDELLTIYRALLLPFRIMYDGTNVGLVPRESSKEIVDIGVLAVLNKEVELGYINKLIGDKQHKFAYTHTLRRNLQLNLQEWQRELIINWKQFNYVAGSRRIGKTYTSGYIAKRELYRKGGGYGARERQIIFVCVSEEKMWQPLQYLLTMCKEDMALGYIKYTQKDKQFENTITGAKLIFRSAGSRTGAASYGADLVIIDEAAMVSDQFWEDLLPIIIQEGATVFAISTINEDVKDNWFYRELIKAEMQLSDDMYAIRVTIDDNELLTTERKESMKGALKNNPMKYWTQLYSIFPSGNTVFSLTGVIQPANNIIPEKVIIGYDPGKIKDNAGIIVVDPQDLRVIEEIKWYQINYKNQKEYMQELKKKYTNSTVVMDRTGVGEGVAEIFGDLVDVYVKYKGSGETNFNAQFGYYQVSKMTLVEYTKLYFENFGLKIDSELTGLIAELKGFQKLNIGKTTTQYGGVGVKDDLVNALMLVCFQMKYVFGINGKNQLEQTYGIQDINPNIQNGLFPYDEYNDDIYKRFNY